MKFRKFKLDNGLRVIFHKDTNTSLGVVNLIYDFGSKDEHPNKTGLAHLLEHLMFEGSANAPDFDLEVEKAGGTNNAFTNKDYTNYYIVLPKVNIETALWIEADRMSNLLVNPENFENQKKVVIEEFKQTTLNEPYGDMYGLAMATAYKKHPYRWPTIGMKPEHIENATREDILELYDNYYIPENAILSVAGDFEFEEIYNLVNKYFGKIPALKRPERNYPQEPPQEKRREKTVKRNVPYDAFYMMFHIGERTSQEYYIMDIVTDILAGGNSGRLYKKFVRENHIFDEIDAFVSSHIEPGLVMFYGRPSKGISMKQAEDTIWQELEKIKNSEVTDKDLQKSLNNLETDLGYLQSSIFGKARYLGLFELMGDANMINKQVEIYQNITKKDIMNTANKVFTQNNTSVLYYLAKNKN